MTDIKKEVKNMSINYNAKMGVDAICNIHRPSPKGGYAMLGFTFHTDDPDGALKLLDDVLVFLVGANQKGWSEFRPEVTGTTEQVMANDTVSDGPEITRTPIDDSGNELKVFTVAGIEKYITKSNKEWLRIHVAETSECKFGLTGKPEWKLPSAYHKWFNETAIISTDEKKKIYTDIPDSMKYVSAEKNDKGYYAYIKDFRNSK